jgi:hypothetical protein
MDSRTFMIMTIFVLNSQSCIGFLQPLFNFLNSKLAHRGALSGRDGSFYRLSASKLDMQSNSGDNNVVYFAYGSNLSPSVLEGLRGIRPLSAEPGLVRNYRLAFNLIGVPFLSPSSASAEPAKGEELHGVVYSLSRYDWFHRCMFE